MPSRSPGMRLRTFQRPGFHLTSEEVIPNTLASARSPPNARYSPTERRKHSQKLEMPTEREVNVARPAQRRVAPRSSLRSDHDHRNR